MAKARKTILEIEKGAEQLSDKQLKERLRKYVPNAIERIAELANSRNDAVALGANKYIVSKFLPDLKAVEMTGKDGKDLPIPLLFKVEHVRSDNGPVETPETTQEN